ncbi:MAG: ATP-binding cassette domain-containing protein [Mesorhizobium sp.]|uniref:AAA family ATPase n=1 Tax=Mesorhizobium sp. TaxID=1871066 RepID=UPI000FE30E5C|nr:AAA family ATPase [Mesorhizobium sp.]RWK20778.1 MAG: ATP-binding cassette domain-containing protein [Mesorhizobium sp.]RWK29198.1 MAG: ATP-binding cassette domain-containing protein [Mesorhizobium sp.]
MSFDLSFDLTEGGPLDVRLEVGQILFVLGANGSGKSSLIQRLYAKNFGDARRISAHRQTWFHTNASTLSAQNKKDTESNIRNMDQQEHSRWKDDYSAHRTSITIFDLLDAENVRSRNIAAAVDANDFELAMQLSGQSAPLKRINRLINLSNMPIEISAHADDQIMASKNGSPLYSIAELSDGERNALLVSANVLTAKAGSILFIDEPERHLHRAIISPLLTLLSAERPDCAFVISTHDVSLPLDNPTARTLLVRGCTFSGSRVKGWDADLVPSDALIDDDLKRDILGGRRKLLFVEGDEHSSLDRPLYSLVFPQVSVIPKRTCRDVEHAVSGVRSASDLHWVQAFGIVDNDRRTPESIAALKAKGVYALEVFSVESIYYHPDIQYRLAQRHSKVTGADPDKLMLEARDAAIAAVASHGARLSERAVEASLREELIGKLPKRQDIAAANVIEVTIDVPAAVERERAILREALERKDLPLVVARYPIRETPALRQIALKLGFQGESQYEDAVRKLLIDEPDALEFVRSLFGSLFADITSG